MMGRAGARLSWAIRVSQGWRSSCDQPPPERALTAGRAADGIDPIIL